ncbi:MAG: glucose/arabinose dehydrogenase [Myxococcota bacterium]|jgi:glucose/arabinose dehydrogenase
MIRLLLIVVMLTGCGAGSEDGPFDVGLSFDSEDLQPPGTVDSFSPDVATLPDAQPADSVSVDVMVVDVMVADADPVEDSVPDGMAPDVAGPDIIEPDVILPEPGPCSFPITPGTDYQLTRVFPTLEIEEPIALIRAPGAPGKWTVASRLGFVWRFDDDPGATAPQTILDLSNAVDAGGDSGLMGAAYHPNFAQNGWLYVSYTRLVGPDAPVGVVMYSRLSRFESTDGGQTFDTASEVVLIQIDQTHPDRFHTNGRIAFGQDGLLYAGFGDGGPQGDLDGHAQNPWTFRGAFLRLDVSGEQPYRIPSDNPYALGGGALGEGAPEVYAIGFRNPWQWHEDPETGDIFVGDVGWSVREEYNRLVPGGNHGWPLWEGTWCHEACPEDHIMPLAQYDHEEGHSITGGPVYRGTAMPEVAGKAIFGDFIDGFIWSADLETGDRRLLVDSDHWITAFTVDEGEIYALDIVYGAILKLEQGESDLRMPYQLADTGCVNPEQPMEVADHVKPYNVTASVYSDLATKQRWVALPKTGDVTWDADRVLLPIGATLVKSFARDGVRMETRLLAHHESGWAGYTYDWAADQLSATLRDPASRSTPSAADPDWSVPTRKQCRKCHTAAAGGALGMTAFQLDDANRAQFDPPEGLPEAMPSPLDEAADLDGRARAYLHTNCSNCHRPDSWAWSPLDLRYDTPFNATGLCGDGWSFPGKLLDPTAPAASGFIVVMTPNDHGLIMPPFGVETPDLDGVSMLTEWVAQQSCDP